MNKIKSKYATGRLGPVPDSLAGFELLCGSMVNDGDLYVGDSIVGWAGASVGNKTDESGRAFHGRIYRRGYPPASNRPETPPAVHHSAERPEEFSRHDPTTAPLAEQSAADRKATPIATGFVDYFPDAMAEVARCSLAGNRQHMPGEPLHWDKSKSADEADALMRHFLDRGTRDTDGQRHSAKVAWRAMALLQREIEAERGAK